jgi:hypothetical protein
VSQSFLDRGQAVGYRWEDTPTLVVTLSDKMAAKMKADGWDVQHEAEIGHFISIVKE